MPITRRQFLKIFAGTGVAVTVSGAFFLKSLLHWKRQPPETHPCYGFKVGVVQDVPSLC